MTYKSLFRACSAVAGLLLCSTLASAQPASKQNDRPCGLQYLAGDWVFMTEVGHQALFPVDGDITAIGTMTLTKEGGLSGKFDATVAEFIFLPNNTYHGSVAVNSDCTGTITFINSQGIMRTDSVVVLSQNELRGMSQDINNLWTYTARRIERSPGADVLASKINAIMRKLIVNPLIFEDDGYVAP